MIVKLHDGNEVEILIYNARNIILEVDPKLVQIVEGLNTITELNFSDGFHVVKGDLFPLISNCDTKTLYKIDGIKRLKNVKKAAFLISCENINKSTHWLLPFVAKNEHTLGYNDVLRNAYCFSNNEHYEFYKEGYIFIKYNYLKEYDYFLNKLKEHPNCAQMYRLHSRFEYVAVFKIPDMWLADVNLLIEGKYSKISEKGKKRILDFHGLKKVGSTGKKLYRDRDYMEELKKKFHVDFDLDELEEKFNVELETLK